MSFSSQFKHILFHSAKFLFPRAIGKIELLANVLFHDYWFFPANSRSMADWLAPALPDPETFFGDLDENSRERIRLFWKRRRFMAQLEKTCSGDRGFLIDADDPKISEHFIIPPPDSKELQKLRKKYHVDGCAEALIYKHGISVLPRKVREYVKQGVFIDAGACKGDSTVALQEFHPALTIAFEPSAANSKSYLTTMRKNHITSFQLVQAGVGAKDEIITFCDEGGPGQRIEEGKGEDKLQIYALDSFLSGQENHNIRVIKADVEGMGVAFLKGAESAIRRCRPVLSLACYHTPEELFGQYEFLKKLDLHYHILFMNMPEKSSFELTMLAYPEELG